MSNIACRKSIYDLGQDAQRNASHAGLLLAKCLRSHDQDSTSKRQLHESAIASSRNALDVYDQAYLRWKEEWAEPSRFELRVKARLSVGLGIDTVLEAGIRLHHTYGTPVIPGSALKGLAAHYCDRVYGRDGQAMSEFAAEGEFTTHLDGTVPSDGWPVKRIGRMYRLLFGDQSFSGHITFHDAWILPDAIRASENKTGLLLDVMTPHHPKYNSGEAGAPPADYDSPNPIPFLSVAGTFLFVVVCDDTDSETGHKLHGVALSLLRGALSEWGAGGKTSSGYGRFVEPPPVQTPPPFRNGERVTAQRIATPEQKTGLWFELPHRRKGILLKVPEREIKVGDSADLWIHTLTGEIYQLSESPSGSGRKNESRGQGPRRRSR